MGRPRLIYYEVLRYQPESLELLEEHFDVLRLPDPGHASAEALGRADALLAPLGFHCGRETIDRAPRLKVIGSNTTGEAHIDVAYARGRGIRVVTLKDERAFLEAITPTSELTWGLILALTRRIVPAHRSVLEGRWDRRPFGGRAMLSRMSLGVAGYGRLGRRVAAVGRSFEMTVRYYDPEVFEETAGIARASSLEELAAVSDVVTIHIPHGPGTERLFDSRLLARFKPGAFLVNTSRGELVDHRALLEALRSGRLAGAAVDVFEGEFEPGFESRLKGHELLAYARESDNLLLTPHIGGSTVDAWRETEGHTIRRMVEALAGRPSP